MLFRSTDPDALSGDWSSTGQFFVTTVNAVPEAPALVSPQNGTTMANVRPELVILNADDSDLDPLVYDWELATDDTFATIIDSGTDVAPQGAVNTAFALAADLTEDTTYCWRARSDDGQATSGYNTACFLVSETNGAPSVPTLNNPSATSTVASVTPVYSWAPSTDPEDDPITYEVEVMDSTSTVVATLIGVSGTVTSMAGDLQNGGTYTWHARAVDRAGLVQKDLNLAVTFQSSDGIDGDSLNRARHSPVPPGPSSCGAIATPAGCSDRTCPWDRGWSP